MKIGINILFLVAGRGGGIERYLRGLIKGLQTIDRENHYILFTNKDCKGTFYLTDNFEEHVCNVSARVRPAKILWEQLFLPVVARRKGVDVLLSTGNIAPVLHPFPEVTIMYDLIPFIMPQTFTVVERLALKTLFYLTAKRSDTIITVSNSSKADIVRRLGVDESKVKVVYGACDEGFGKAEVDRQRLRRQGIEGSYILYVASRRPYKNIDGLIRAYRLLKDRYSIEHKLVITGLGGRADPALFSLVKESGLEGDVIFTGFVPDEELPTLYSGAELFVYPSFYEGFGLPILEAMACGVPVACSNRTSLPEVAADAAILFEPSNIEEMAHSIHKILSEGALKEELIRRGRKRVEEFSWQKTANKVLSVLEETVKRRTR